MALAWSGLILTIGVAGVLEPSLCSAFWVTKLSWVHLLEAEWVRAWRRDSGRCCWQGTSWSLGGSVRLVPAVLLPVGVCECCISVLCLPALECPGPLLLEKAPFFSAAAGGVSLPVPSWSSGPGAVLCGLFFSSFLTRLGYLYYLYWATGLEHWNTLPPLSGNLAGDSPVYLCLLTQAELPLWEHSCAWQQALWLPASCSVHLALPSFCLGTYCTEFL